ncbi:DUF4870 domain-containing protein [Flavobacterium dankookense]|uniref:Tic20 family protein n=1 Tax=Flavobacterium dankookense TaxID=706186 RepID=A0A4V3CSI8_9FLAO|nr:DUF4870 domain-containing protein [Flavobacterium dankookense]TDP60782.1 hypothetical protein BC748_0382 [Flavobacterium dankookense]
MTSTNGTNTATLLHLSALTQYFFPFGNYIFPILIWSAKKNESELVDASGKSVLNFQLSMFLYTLTTLLIAIPVFIYCIFKNISFTTISDGNDFIIENFSAGNISGIVILAIVAVVLFSFLKVIEFILIIYGSVKTSNGEVYKYPLSINFLK